MHTEAEIARASAAWIWFPRDSEHERSALQLVRYPARFGGGVRGSQIASEFDAAAVLDQLRVGEVEDPGIEAPSADHDTAVAAARQRRVPVEIVHQGDAFRIGRLRIRIVWPDDRAWVLVGEVDWDSTIIGGSAELIRALVADERLEALPIREGADLTWDSDEVNR